MCLMQNSIRVEAQDTVSFLKKNLLGLTINGLAPDETIPGSGVSLHYAKWKNINYAHKNMVYIGNIYLNTKEWSVK